MTTTYSRAFWEGSQEAWNTGGFGPEWKAIRQIAANNGFCWPPQGTAFDSRQEDPSPRAIIHRALTDNPTETTEIVTNSSNWHEVIDGIFKMELRLSLEAADQEEADAEAKRSRDARDARRGTEAGQGLPRPKARPVAVGDVLGSINLGSHPGVSDDG